MRTLCVHCGLHYNKRLSALHPCAKDKEHYYMDLHEEADIENIIRRAKAGRDLALDNKDGAQVDNFEMILVYARGLLPEGNRHAR